MSLIRRKRASDEDLYRHCAQGGDCITDVKNKYEHTTLADYLLKIFGSLVYFGGLGIGSGRGSGGSLGYRPLGGRGTVTDTTTLTPARPSLTIDALGPTDIIPVDPTTSSIVPLQEGTLDVGFVAPDAGPGTGVEEIELYTINTTTGNSSGQGPTVAPTLTASEDGSVAILDVNATVQNAQQVFYDPGAPPLHELTVFTADPSTTTDINVFVEHSFSGDVVGGGLEDIPLERLDVSTFEIEEPPQTSTPSQRLDTAINRAKELYNRFVRQVPVSSSDFITQPSRLVEFQIENPAFDPEVSIEFERDLATVAAAPDSDFADVIRLGRPHYGLTDEGTIRVSRLGRTGTISTRSGTIIGQPVHYFYDISDITAAESIELTRLGEQTHSSTIVDDLLQSTFIDIPNANNTDFTEADLEDHFIEGFSDAHLVLQTTDEENETLLIPTLPPGAALKVFVPDIGNGYLVNYPNIGNTDISIVLPNNIPITPIVWPSDTTFPPAFTLEIGVDYNLHPSLIPKKRRRLDNF